MGHFVYFFQLVVVDDSTWEFELIKYDILNDADEAVSKHSFACQEEPEDFDLDEGEKYELLAVMIADEFAGNKIDTT